MTRKAIVNRIVEAVLIGLMGAAVVNVSWQVFARYVLGAPSSFTDELARMLLIWIGLIGAAYGVGRRNHLSMNLIAARLGGRRRDLLGVVIDAVVGLFGLAVMVVGGGHLVMLTRELDQRSPALGVPLGLVYAAIPMAGILVVFYTVGFVRARMARLRSGGVGR